jgi:hypothetical protein
MRTIKAGLLYSYVVRSLAPSLRPGCSTLPSDFAGSNLILHLGEHHGDGSPGARVRVTMDGIEAFRREITSRGYRYMRPGLETTQPLAAAPSDVPQRPQVPG